MARKAEYPRRAKRPFGGLAWCIREGGRPGA